jgi:hypothetical protein
VTPLAGRRAPALARHIALGGQMPLPKTYRNFAEFEREILRSNRVGFSVEDIVEDSSFDTELDFEKDSFDVSDDNDF